MTAPERIWHTIEEQPYQPAGGSPWTNEKKVEYVRADLAAVQPAQVRVSDILKAAGEEYVLGHVMETDDLRMGRKSTVRGMMVRLGLYPELEGAIDAALEPQPDPRDEVIKGLVEALECIDQYGSDTLSGNARGPDDRAWQRDGVIEMVKRARAALAAAKKVQK